MLHLSQGKKRMIDRITYVKINFGVLIAMTIAIVLLFVGVWDWKIFLLFFLLKLDVGVEWKR